MNHIDKKLSKWFQNDTSRALLRKIELQEFGFRGLKNVSICFDFPITAICGKNGSGKSTILALACCSYHGKNDQYYTFKDFFKSTPEEQKQHHTLISSISHNNWIPTPAMPTGVGIGRKSQIKKINGRWTNYKKRISKKVMYFGMNRIVPPYERPGLKNYSEKFKGQMGLLDAKHKPNLDAISKSISFILSKNIKIQKTKTYKGFTVALVEIEGRSVSSFNLGAGEAALIELFLAMYNLSDSEPTLIIIDEIELGLHPEAQRKLIVELKKICLTKKFQMIFSTHSSHILESLPKDARILIRKEGDNCFSNIGISSHLAMSHLGGRVSSACDLIVEDETARGFLEIMMPIRLREHVRIIPFGSWGSICKYMGGVFKSESKTNTICVLDGDQRNNKAVMKQFISGVETETLYDKGKEWFKKRLSFLPGDTWPEKWILQQGKEFCDQLALSFNAPTETVMNSLDQSLRANKHNEFLALSESLLMEESAVRTIVYQVVASNKIEDFSEIINLVEENI